MNKLHLLYIATLLLLQASASHAGRIVLYGGKGMPAKATYIAAQWGKHYNAKTGQYQTGKLFIVGFPSQVPQEYFKFIGGEFKDHAAYRDSDILTIESIKSKSDRDRFLEMFNQADLVYFTGGDQSRGMKMLKDWGLLSIVREGLKKKIYLGKSAGTAMSASTMITGTTTQEAEGLGLIDAIVDTHFLKRSEPEYEIKRTDRLKALMKKTGKHYGIGVDEDGALIIDGDFAKVIGNQDMVFYELLPNGEFQEHRLVSERKFNLRTWETAPALSGAECGGAFGP